MAVGEPAVVIFQGVYPTSEPGTAPHLRLIKEGFGLTNGITKNCHTVLGADDSI